MHICRIWRVLRWMLISELYCKLIWFISNLLLLFLGSCVQGQQRWGWYSCFVLVLQSTVFCGEEILSSKKRSSHASLLSLVRQLIIIMRRYYTTLLPRQRAKVASIKLNRLWKHLDSQQQARKKLWVKQTGIKEWFPARNLSQ